MLGWTVIVATLHHTLHAHTNLLLTILVHPLQKFLAATLGISTLIYLIAWSLPHIQRPTWKVAVSIAIWSTLIVAGHGVTHVGENNAETVLLELQQMMGLTGFVLLACIYALVLAMPFVAGMEIGLLIMAIFGVPGVIVAYSGTIIGLNLAFAAGRVLPVSLLDKGLKKLSMRIEYIDFDNLLEQLVKGNGWQHKFGNTLLRNRYLTLALSLNFPGNSFLGGGGGLSVLSGMSHRLIHWPYFALVTIIATLPVPLLILFGFLGVEGTAAHNGWFHSLLDTFYSWLSFQ